jgi:hypothetical protein
MAITLDGTTGIVVSGNTNTFAGVYVGEGAGAIATNTAIGVSSLAANTTGQTNTALGASALAVNTSGSSNTAVGRDALQGSSTSSLHTAIGTSALYSNTSGGSNTAVGATSLYVNTTGSFNVAMGVQALRYSETASGNTAVGYQAGYNNTTGTYGTYVGYGAGLFITTGNKNTIIGAYTGNNDGLDIRTASNYAVISDGDGNRLLSTANGYSLALDGGAVPQTGTGITFPAAQSASSNANTLDDYEEGTWTPTFSLGTFTYNQQVGSYTKVGRLVTVCFLISWTAKSSSGTISVAGFPFTSISTTGYRATGTVGYTAGVGFSAGTQISWAMSENYVTADLAIVTSGAATTFANVTNMSASGELQGTISYFAVN